MGAVLSLHVLGLLKIITTRTPNETNPTVFMFNAQIEQENRNLKKTIDNLKKDNDNLKNGYSPDVYPTKAEMEKIKETFNIREDCLNCAVVGLRGVGKSSLINAFRGLGNRDPCAAKTGIVDTTKEVIRYPDPHPDRERIVWYDIPGAGTFENPAPRYFVEKGLFIFDFIIVAIDNDVNTVDIDILRKCASLGKPIPTFIVRSKADQHIGNLMSQLDVPCNEARDMFITDTRKSFQENMKKAKLNHLERIYLVSSSKIRGSVVDRSLERSRYLPFSFSIPFLFTKQTANDVIDEYDLIEDLLETIVKRRFRDDA